jgi:hypothetical protein
MVMPSSYQSWLHASGNSRKILCYRSTKKISGFGKKKKKTLLPKSWKYLLVFYFGNIWEIMVLGC